MAKTVVFTGGGSAFGGALGELAATEEQLSSAMGQVWSAHATTFFEVQVPADYTNASVLTFVDLLDPSAGTLTQFSGGMDAVTAGLQVLWDIITPSFEANDAVTHTVWMLDPDQDFGVVYLVYSAMAAGVTYGWDIFFYSAAETPSIESLVVTWSVYLLVDYFVLSLPVVVFSNDAAACQLFVNMSVPCWLARLPCHCFRLGLNPVVEISPQQRESLRQRQGPRRPAWHHPATLSRPWARLLRS